MFKAVLVLLAMGFSAHVYADDNSAADQTKNKVKVEDVNGRKNKVDGDIDQEIERKASRRIRLEVEVLSLGNRNLHGRYDHERIRN